MKKALIFYHYNRVDFVDLRTNVVRIPEVLKRIHEAQDIWLSLGYKEKNILNSIYLDDSLFWMDRVFKDFVFSIIQVGLFDRYIKQNEKPYLMLGEGHESSAIRCCAGFLSFKDLVLSYGRKINYFSSLGISADLDFQDLGTHQVTNQDSHMVKAGNFPVKNMKNSIGTSWENIRVFQSHGPSYKEKACCFSDLKEALNDLKKTQSVSHFINIGPCAELSRLQKQFKPFSFELVDFIDTDPALSWFWSSFKQAQTEKQLTN